MIEKRDIAQDHSHPKMGSTLLGRKHYAEFPVNIADPTQLHQRIRHVYCVNNLCLASCEGVLYVFRKDKVSVYASTSIDFASATSRILSVTGARSTGKITTIVFEAAIKMETSSLTLDLLHYRLSASPPVGTEMNIFDPAYHPDLFVKVCPFQDGFTVAFHFKSTGKCLVVCDATRCATAHREEAFRCRASKVMESLAHLLHWE